MPKVVLTAEIVATAKCPEGRDREYFWDKKMPGFGLMATAAGARSYVVQYRADGRSRRATISGSLPLSRAKREAKIMLGSVAKGGDPLGEKRKAREARRDTLRAIVEHEYLANSAVKQLRSVGEKRAVFARHIFPALGAKPLKEIKRREIVSLLDRIKAKKGQGAANDAFKVFRKFLNWHQARDDEFRSPLVPGSYAPVEGEGARTLTDDEIRILWDVTSEGRNAFDHFIRFCLLTAVRRDEAANMTRAELSPDGSEWTIPESRYKKVKGRSHAHLVPLSGLARQVLGTAPTMLAAGKDSPWLFTTNGSAPISGFSKFKAALDKRLNAALAKESDAVHQQIVADLNSRYPGMGYQPFGERWQIHSTRKTARTLLAQAGISKDIAERCLGHVEGGISGVYNHHEMKAEKRVAFESLAREIERIADGSAAKVLPMVRA